METNTFEPIKMNGPAMLGGYYVIETGVPITNTPSPKIVDHPLYKVMTRMEVGQSVLVPESEKKKISYYASKLWGEKSYITRREKGVRGQRVWRVR